MTVMVVCLQVSRDFSDKPVPTRTKSGAGLSAVRTARAAAGRRSGKTAARRRRWRRVNNRRSWSFSSKPFAGVGVTHRQHEEAEAKGQHEDIQHQVLLVLSRLFLCATLACFGEGLTLDRRCIRALPLSVSVGVRCHSPHMFSRRARKQSYRNLIKTRLYAALAAQLAVQRSC